MLKYFVVVFGATFGFLAFIYFWIGVPKVYRENPPLRSTLHLANNPSQSIEDIEVIALYFIPKDKTPILQWQGLLRTNLEKLREFHLLQFQGRSRISSTLYLEPVYGLEETLFYNTDVTEHGNPHALKKIIEELEARKLIAQSSEPYQVVLIMYEGVGASGSDNVALISRTFLSEELYKHISSSLLAHEFYHTLGVPDAYEIPSGISFSSDLMGLGRFIPLSQSYLDHHTLVSLGL